MKAIRQELKTPIEDLQERFSYNAEDGRVFDHVEGHFLNPTGGVGVGGEHISTTRLIWTLHYGVWPQHLIDHKNRDRAVNSIFNLRRANHNQNGANKLLPSTSGFRGVSFNQRSRIKPWMALIRINGKQTYLGSFATKEEAHEAYCTAAVKHHGEFAEFRTQ